MRVITTGLVAGLLVVAGAVAGRADFPNARREPSFKPSGAIHGYLVNGAGEGLSGMVALCDADGRVMSEHHTSALRRGRFDIDTLLPGTYTLRVKWVGPYTTDLVPPADMQVTVRAKHVERPHLVARTGPRTP